MSANITFEEAVKNKIKGIYIEDDFVGVVTKSGDYYKLRELTMDELDACYKAATKVMGRDRQGNPIKEVDSKRAASLIVARSCIEPELDDSFDIGKLKGSDAILLNKAIEELYDLGNY